MSTATALQTPEIEYPESDGTPMGETGIHVVVMMEVYRILRHYFADASDLYIAANMFLYYEEGNPAAVIAPDVFIARGVENGQELRRTFKVWEEGCGPAWALEVTSKKTAREDRGSKMHRYAKLGCRELVLFDPLEEYLEPSLQGFRLVKGAYKQIPLNPDGEVECRTLGLLVGRDGTGLRFRDPATGQLVATPEEEAMVQGREEGHLSGRREMFRETLAARFGDLPGWANAMIDSSDDAALQAWTKRVFTAATLREIL